MKTKNIKVSRRILREALKNTVLLNERGVPPGGGAAPSTGTSGPTAGKGRGSGKQSADPFAAVAPETASPSDKMWAALDPDKADSDLSNVEGMRTGTGASTEYKNVEKLKEPISVIFEFAGEYYGKTEVEVTITHRLQRGAGRWHGLAETGGAKELEAYITNALDSGLTTIGGSIGATFGMVQQWEEIQEIYNVWLFMSKGKAPTKYPTELSEMKIVDAASVNSKMEAAGLINNRIFWFHEESGSIVDGLGIIYDEYGPGAFDKDIEKTISWFKGKETQNAAEAVRSLTKDIPEETSAWTTVSDWMESGYGAVMGSDDPRAVRESFRRRRKRIKKLLKEAPGDPPVSNWTGPAYEDPANFGKSYEGIGTDYVKYVTKDGRDPRAKGAYRFIPGDQLLLWYNKTGEQITINIQPQTGGRAAGGTDALKTAVNQLINDWAGVGGGQTDLLPWDEMSIWIINSNHQKQPEHPTRPGGMADPYRHPDFKALLEDRINANYERFRNEWSSGEGDAESKQKGKCPDMKVTANFSGGTTKNVEEIERLLNGYIKFHGIEATVSADGKWNEDAPFKTVVMHAKDNHPEFYKIEGVTWDTVASNWKSGSKSLGSPGYTGNLRGMIAFLADAYNCDKEYGKKSRGGGGGSAGGAPKKDKGESKGGCETEKRTWRDVQIGLTGPIENMDATGIKSVKTNLAQLTAKWVSNPPHKMNPVTQEHSGVFNIGVGGRVKNRKSHDWNVPKSYEKIIDKAMKRAIKDAKRDAKGIDKVRGSTVTITIPCGDYSGIHESKNLSDEQLLVEMIRKLIRE